MQGWNESNCVHGTVLSEYGVRPTDERVRAVHEREPPTSVYRVVEFPGTYQLQLKPLANLCDNRRPTTKDERQDTKCQWGKEENKAFEALRKQLAEASMMAFYDKNAPTEVVTDASLVRLGAILVQEQQGVKRAVSIASCSLSEVERRYRQTD